MASPTTTTTASVVTQTDTDTINWILGMIVFIGAMAFLASSSKAGYAAVYYSLVLLLVFVGVTQAPWIAQKLSYIGGPIPNGYQPPAQTGKTAQTTTTALSMPHFGTSGIIPL